LHYIYFLQALNSIEWEKVPTEQRRAVSLVVDLMSASTLEARQPCSNVITPDLVANKANRPEWVGTLHGGVEKPLDRLQDRYQEDIA
jgi:hypothetical protein